MLTPLPDNSSQAGQDGFKVAGFKEQASNVGLDDSVCMATFDKV